MVVVEVEGRHPCSAEHAPHRLGRVGLTSLVSVAIAVGERGEQLGLSAGDPRQDSDRWHALAVAVLM